MRMLPGRRRDNCTPSAPPPGVSLYYRAPRRLLRIMASSRALARAAIALRLLLTISWHGAEALSAAAASGDVGGGGGGVTSSTSSTSSSSSSRPILRSSRDYRLLEVVPHDTSSFTCVPYIYSMRVPRPLFRFRLFSSRWLPPQLRPPPPRTTTAFYFRATVLAHPIEFSTSFRLPRLTAPTRTETKIQTGADLLRRAHIRGYRHGTPIADHASRSRR